MYKCCSKYCNRNQKVNPTRTSMSRKQIKIYKKSLPPKPEPKLIPYRDKDGKLITILKKKGDQV